MARLLVRSGKLTEYQAKAILQGKTKGLVFGNYVVLDQIGAGGMGVVLKARHGKMDRIVAVKVLPEKMLKSPAAVDRFYREVKAAARLSHPNIVTAHDAGESDGTHYLVLEYVEGQDLADLVKERGALPVDETIDYILQAARGLGYAHGQGIVHRDIKPANLLLDASGTLKILDMGLARFEQGLGDEERDRLTQSGQVMGTCDYMAPEQAEDTHRADRRADIYSLGCSLYRLLTGKAMYLGSTVMEILLAHRDQPIPSLSVVRPDVSSQLDAVYQRMVAKRPEDRYQSMGDVIGALESCRKAVGVASDGQAETMTFQDGGKADSKLTSFLQGLSPVREETIQRQVDRETGHLVPPPAAGGKTARSSWLHGTLTAVVLMVVTLGVGLIWRGRGQESPPQVAQSPTDDTTNPTQDTSQPELQKQESEQIPILTAASSTEAPTALEEPGGEQNAKPPEEPLMPSEPPADEMSANRPETPAKTEGAAPSPPVVRQEDPAAKARRELLESQRTAEAKYAAAMEPVEAKVAIWDFAAAWQATEAIRLEEPELKTRLETRRDEIRRMELLKRRMIDKIGQADPPLKKSDLKIRGIGGVITDAGPAGITTTTMKGEVERLTWNDLGSQAIDKFMELAVDPASGEDCLAAGLLVMASGGREAAGPFFDKAKAAGADITVQLTAVAVSTLAEASGLVSQKEYEKAASLLENLEAKYADLPWLAAHREMVDAVRITARMGVRELEAEMLYAEAAALFTQKELFDLKPVLEKLKTDYATTQPVTDVSRSPSFAELEKATADLGKILTVRLDGKGDFTSIQAAIDAAPAMSIIQIEDDGPYSEQITIPKEKEDLAVRGKRGCLPVISSLGKPELMQVNLVSLEAPRCRLERVVVLHTAASDQNLRCVSIHGTEVRIREVLVYMEGSKEAFSVSEPATCQMDHCLLASRALVAGRLTAHNSLILNRDHPEHFNTPEAATVQGYGSFSIVELYSCTILGCVAFCERGILSDSIVVAVSADGQMQVDFSDVFGNYHNWTSGFYRSAVPGKGTFVADPRFRDPANLDFRLMPDSPCIGKASDAGDIGCRYTPEIIELCRIALELRAKGLIKF
ncbi:MAG: serine/threonine protein kinase [Thermoguttaceae bacterium]